jgi:rhamnosyltransferase
VSRVSVVIPVLNAARWLPGLFKSLANQQPRPPDEIIIIDSGSTDDTLTLAEAHPAVMVIKITNFTHGGSRNTGIKAATGDVVVLMTQDAEPADEHWLARLNAPLDDPTVAGVYSRQIPRPDASPMEQFFLLDRFPPGDRVTRTHRGPQPPVYPQTFFSNVSSAARRETWLKFPFDETLLMSEDQQFARDVLMAGLAIVYEPASLVLHSHAYGVRETFKRYFDSVVAFRQMSDRHSFAASAGLGVGKWFQELRYIARNSPKTLPLFILHQAAKSAGTLTAHAAGRLPRSLCTRLSMQPHWWKIVHSRN